MSEIIWKNILFPLDGSIEKMDFSQYALEKMNCNDVIRFGPEKEKLVYLENPRTFRSMSRAATLLAAVCMPGKGVVDKSLISDPFSTGIYCALEQGPIDYQSALDLSNVSDSDFAEKFKKVTNPKQYFQFLPNIALAQLGILLGIMGPMNLFHHSQMACLHALDQAELDLCSGRIDTALVCTAFAIENPLLNFRVGKMNPSLPISEAAAAIILKRNGSMSDWPDNLGSTKKYGISEPLIALLQSAEFFCG